VAAGTGTGGSFGGVRAASHLGVGDKLRAQVSHMVIILPAGTVHRDPTLSVTSDQVRQASDTAPGLTACILSPSWISVSLS
jgi:hypothetical protein